MGLIQYSKINFPSNNYGTIAAPSASLDWGLIQQQLLKLAFENNKQQIQQNVKQQMKIISLAIRSKETLTISNKNKAVDTVSQGVTNAIGKLFGN